jgi:hypothetical protein
MKRQNRLTSKTHTEEQQLNAHQARQDAVREFASVEDMLRHDASHTPVPPAIAHRLEKSISEAPRSRGPWWRRLFGGQEQ